MQKMILIFVILIALSHCLGAIHAAKLKKKETQISSLMPNYAVITLVTGENTGYAAGATALGQSLIEVGNTWDRIAMVSPEVTASERKELSLVWRVVEVESILCNHKSPLDPTQYDLKGQQYQDGIKKWSKTCTKFRAWEFVEYSRIVFMDSDLLVINSIDDVMTEYSNASFLASPEAFPPDNFNSGFMVIKPSEATFTKLLELNDKVGSAEGGDQGVFNNGLCPNWFYADSNDPDCGRLPWKYNVPAAHFEKYNTLLKMSKLPPPAVIHFVADGKPWKILMYEYVSKNDIKIPESTLKELANQAQTHIMWRSAYFKAIKGGQPAIKFLVDLVQNGGLMLNADDNDTDTIIKKTGLPQPKPATKGRHGDNKASRANSHNDNKKEEDEKEGEGDLEYSEDDNIFESSDKARSKASKKESKIKFNCPACSCNENNIIASNNISSAKRIIRRLTKVCGTQ